jgi:hypothetical protein
MNDYVFWGLLCTFVPLSVELACFAGRVYLRSTRAHANRLIALKEDQRMVQRQVQTHNIIDWPSPLGVEHKTKDQTLIERASYYDPQRLRTTTYALTKITKRHRPPHEITPAT